MSDSPEIGINEDKIIRGEHGVHVEPDHNAGGRVALVGGIAVASFILAGLWAGWMYVESRKAFAPEGLPGIPAELTEAQYEIGIVNQWDFKLDQRGTVLPKKRAEELKGYGWVDRNQQRIHAPVESAFAGVIGDRGAPIGGAAAAPESNGTPADQEGAEQQEAPATPPAPTAPAEQP